MAIESRRISSERIIELLQEGRTLSNTTITFPELILKPFVERAKAGESTVVKMERCEWIFQKLKLRDQTLSLSLRLIACNFHKGVDFSGSCFTDQLIFRGSEFKESNFTGVQFRSNTCFSDALLANANFSGSLLRNVDFSGADLRRVNFRNSNLEGANLRNTELYETDFTGANISHIDLREARYSTSTQWPEDVEIPEGAKLIDELALQYELLVARLLRVRLRYNEDKICQIFHRKRYRGASGHNHEIDISFETFIGGIKLLILLECKCYNTPVGNNIVAEFAYRIKDIGAHKGILVTTKGYQSGAIKIARREGIALVVAKETWRTVHYADIAPKPRYVIRLDDQSVVYPKGLDMDPYRFDGRGPLYECESCPVSSSTYSQDIAFVPFIEGFDGDPFFDLFTAAAIFLKENEIEEHPFIGLSKLVILEGDQVEEYGIAGLAITKKPILKTDSAMARWRVLLHDDTETTMGCVAHILQKFFDKRPAEATYIMLKVHYMGSAVAGVYTETEAKRRATEAIQEARSLDMPLRITTNANADWAKEVEMDLSEDLRIRIVLLVGESEAIRLRHKHVSVEHVAYALTVDDEMAGILEACGVNIEFWKDRFENYLTVKYVDSWESEKRLVQILELARKFADSEGSGKVTCSDVLLELLREKGSVVRGFLEFDGLSRSDILGYIRNRKIDHNDY